MAKTIKNEDELVNEIENDETVQKITEVLGLLILEQILRNSVKNDEIFEISEKIAKSKAKELVRGYTRANIRSAAVAIENGKDPLDYIGLDKNQIKNVIKQEKLLEKSNLSENSKKKIISAQKAKEKLKRSDLGSKEISYGITKAVEYVEAKATGYTSKRSIHANDKYVCPDCIAAADEGWIDIDSVFAATDRGEPPYHPRCRCSISYK